MKQFILGWSPVCKLTPKRLEILYAIADKLDHQAAYGDLETGPRPLSDYGDMTARRAIAVWLGAEDSNEVDILVTGKMYPLYVTGGMMDFDVKPVEWATTALEAFQLIENCDELSGPLKAWAVADQGR